MKINTGVKSTSKRDEIMGSVMGQLSDGIWENNRSMEKYWKYLKYGVGPDGNYWIEDHYNTCADPQEFFANKIKQIIKIEAEDSPNKGITWARNCRALTTYLSYYEDITVGDCYELYELLKGRNTTKNSYSKYSDYSVTLTIDGFSKVIVVSALSEYEARDKAKTEFIKQVKAEAILK